jgi:hypothetical protein
MTARALTFLALTLFASPLWAQSSIDGDWLFSMQTPFFGDVEADVTLITDGNTLSGQFDLGNGRVWPIEEGSVAGSAITFRITRDGANLVYRMNGEVTGDSITGFAIAMGTSIVWTMARQP